MTQLTEAYLIFLAGLGWMVVSWTAVPEVVGRRAASWLVAFAMANAFAAAVFTTFAKHAMPRAELAESKLALLAQLATAALLFEFLLRLRRADAGHRLPLSWLHLVAAPVALLIVAGHVSVAHALLTGLIVALLLGTAREFRRIAPPGDPRRRGLGLAAAGFALLAGAEGFATFGASPAGTLTNTIVSVVRATGPWLICFGVTEALFALLGTRSYAGRVFLGCLALTPLFTPLISDRIMPRFEAGALAHALRTSNECAAEFDSAAITRLAADTATPADHAAIAARLAAIRKWQIAPERTYLWTVRAGLVVPLAGATGELRRDTTAAELTPAAPPAAFIRPALSDGWTTWLSVNAPFPGTSPPLWLALDYRASDWSRLMTTLRDSVYGGLATVAIFLTVAIVLLWRRALENRRFATLRDTETASRAKSEFLSFLSHELRTPLQSILGRAELLARTPLASTQQRHLETIDAQGQLLLRLVTDLLDLGTIEAGKLSLAPAPFSLRRSLAACEDVARRQAEGKAVTVSVVLDPTVPDDLVADETRLRQILVNLLHNAVKFTPAGAVTLHVSGSQISQPQTSAPDSSTSLLQLPPHVERLTFAVHDTGPGLPPAQLDRLFTLFTRLDPGEGFRREGTGVGLALVRRLCTLMGGTVTAANRPAGGAVFTVQLAFPLAPAGDATPSSRLPVAIAPALTPLRILVVDDNTAARELLTEALRDAGHTVEAAPDARTALAAYAAHPPDVIVLDLNLPDLDGLEVARRIRTLAAPSRGPRIVGCSAEAFAETRPIALAAGMDAFLEKPVRLATLLSVVAPPPATTAPSFPPENGIAPATDDVFGRLRAAGQLARTREIWVTEWPLLRAKLDAAVTAHEPAAVVRHTHYLRSTALLLGDPALADATRALADAAQAGDWPAARVCLEELTTRAAALP